MDVDLLDRLMNQVGELVLARNQILQFAGFTDDASLTAASQRLNLITSELQEGVMKTRMQPIGVAWSMMPRLVRDLARTCAKQIELTMEGSETELDRTIIEAIRDPRRIWCATPAITAWRHPPCARPGGKPATRKLVLGAFHEGGDVIIEITDDGAGIDIARVKAKALERGLITPDHAARMSDREAVQLIYRPGFSTAERITGVSGRGVGMDVVKTNIERVGGTLDVATTYGAGTSVHIKIPLTLAINAFADAPAADPLAAGPLQVIVFVDGPRGLGLVVGEIVDIVQEAVHMRKQSAHSGLLGSAVIGGQVTDFLDLRPVIEASGEKWLAGGAARTATVLVAGGSGFTRTLIRGSIEMAGHRVVEAASRAEALERVARERVDVVALAADLDNLAAGTRENGTNKQAGIEESLAALLRQHADRDVPVLPLSGVETGDHRELNASIERLLAHG